MNNKRQLLLSIGLVLILVLMIVGISYAAFKFTGLGNKPNTITTGAITMEYTESTNTISMTGALPTTDATGKVRLTAGEYFDFTLSGTIKGSENINWEIAAEDGICKLKHYSLMYQMLVDFYTEHCIIKLHAANFFAFHI